MSGSTRTDNALRDLAERIRSVEARGVAAGVGAVRTGWRTVDAVLPGGGLRRSATHEIVSGARPEGTARARRRDWEPPLAMLAHMANGSAGEEGWTVWIGRRVWPYGLSVTAGRTLGRMLCIDPPDTGARDWVLDAALRCPGLTVVADGTDLDAAAARRVQLAAEAGGSMGLIARPWWEAGEISFAWSRWLVAPVAHAVGVEVVASRWCVTLDRCKGLRRCDSHSWQIERSARGGVLTLAAEVADGPRSAVAAS